MNVATGSELLNNWGISFDFSVSNGEISYKSFDTTNGKGVNLKLFFNNFDLLEHLSKNPYEIVEVSNENIKGIKTSYQDIDIPFQETNVHSIKFIPHPKVKFTADVNIPYTDYYIEDVTVESFGNSSVDLVRFTCSIAKFEFDFRKNSFNFKVNDVRSLNQARNIYGFLNQLINYQGELFIQPLDSNIKSGDFSFIFNNDNKEQVLKRDIAYIFKLIEDLIIIEKYYRIKFKNFYFSLDKDERNMIGLLLLRAKGEEKVLSEIKLNIDLIDEETFKKSILEKPVSPVAVEYSNGVHISLFGEVVPITDKKLTISAPDAFIVNKKEIVKKIKANKLNSIALHIKSKSNQLVCCFK